MQKLSKLSYIAFMLSSALLFSCSKDDDKVDNQKLLLTEIKTGDLSKTAEYDNDGKITRVNTKSNGVLDLYRQVEYNAIGKISRVTTLTANNEVDAYEIYEYNSAGLLSKRSSFKKNYISTSPPFILTFYYTYEYNSDKNITKRRHFDSQNNLVDYSDYTYPSKTVAQVEDYLIESGIPTFLGVAEFTFDDKISPVSLWGVVYDPEAVFYDNVVSVKFSSSGTMHNILYTYEYNSEGYPTKVTSTHNGVASSGPTIFIYNYQ